MKIEYKSLEQRMVHIYLNTFPSFVPSKNGPGIEAQEQFYEFMSSLYNRLMEDPKLLVSSLHVDDAYTNRFNKGQDNKPKLKVHMRKIVKEVDSLLTAMFLLGQTGRIEANTLVADESVKMRKKHRLILEQLGLHQSDEPNRVVYSHDKYTQMFSAWIWMASRPDASLLRFSRCLFLDGHPYSSQIYARLSGNEKAFHKLEGYLIENGYTRIDNMGGQVAIDYVKSHGDKQLPIGGFVYGVRHTGISASYDLLVKQPFVFGLCIPRMKEILNSFNNMGARVQDFVIARTKKCDSCRYCIQTDKTGKRPLANISVNHGGREFRLCPYFPGFNYCWNYLSDNVVDDMIGMINFMDQLFDGE